MKIPYNYIKQLKNLPKHGVTRSPDYGDDATAGGKQKFDLDKTNNAQRQADITAILNLNSKQKDLLDALTNSYYDLAKATKLENQTVATAIKTGATFQVGINKLIGTKEALGKAIINATKKTTVLEQRNKELNKTFGISSVTAAGLGTAFDNLGGAIGTGGKQIRKYAQSLNAILPLQSKNIANALKFKTVTQAEIDANAEAIEQRRMAGKEATKAQLEFSKYQDGDKILRSNINSQLLETQRFMQENLGLTGETANKFALFSATIGDGSVGAKDVAIQLNQGVQELEAMTGAVGLQKSLMQDIGKLSADVALQFSKNPQHLALAAMKAKALGTDLETVYSIGKNLLNIESSVNNELEYQLLSGKRLINQDGESLTQKYREATLSGDQNAMAQSLNEIIAEQGDTISTNFMARKKLAETLGIGEDKLAKMVQQRNLLEQMGDESGASKILELSGDQLAAQVEKFQSLDKDDPARKAFDELLKSQLNTLTTDEKQVYYLEEIATNLIGEQVRLAGTSQTEIIRATQEGFSGEGAKSRLKETTESIENTVFGSGPDGRKQMLETVGAMGKLAIAGKSAEEQISAFANLIPFAGDVVKKLGTMLGDASFSNIDSVNMTTTGTISIGSGVATKGEVEGEHDAIVQVNDAVLFNPRDKFKILASTSEGSLDKTAQAMTGGGGSDFTFDYNKMASMVAGAMKNISIVAPTDIYADSKMNIRSIG